MNRIQPAAHRAVLSLFALVLCATMPMAHAQDLKVGYVDVEKIRKNAPQSIAAAQKLQNEFAPREDHLQSLLKKVVELEKRLESDGDVMSAERKAELEREIQHKRRDFVRERKEMHEDLAIRRNEEIGKLQERLATVVRDVSSREGYDLVVSNAVALYASKRIDMTDLVLEELGSN